MKRKYHLNSVIGRLVSSKLEVKTIIEYAQQVVAIAGYSLFHHKSAVWKEWKNAIKFGPVGVSGIVVNEGALISLKEYSQDSPFHLQAFVPSNSLL